MSEQIAQEPTMEEILASIRRIISEDEAPADARADAPALHAVEPAPAPEPEAAELEEEDVLELNQPYDPEPAHAMDDDIESAPRFEPEPPHPEPEPAPRWEAPAQDFSASFQQAPVSRLVDEPVANNIADILGDLHRTTLLPDPNRTFEAFLTQLMTPILKEWCNQNLSKIVEDAVRKEIATLAEQSRRR